MEQNNYSLGDPMILTDDLDSNLSFISSPRSRSSTASASASASDTMNRPTGSSSSLWKPRHQPPCDTCWRAIIQRSKYAPSSQLEEELLFLRRLGSGDIGSVYLVEVKGSGDGCLFAVKVMDKNEMAARNKETRATIERQILEMLDHPFLPTLYATLDSPTSPYSALLTDFCPGGDLHVLRQRLPHQRFHEPAVQFYASEVIAAFEYLHMKGIIYRDLKPENVLVRSDGHIMLTDFDLSLKDDNSTSTAQIVSDKTPPSSTTIDDQADHSSESDDHMHQFATSSCILPNCIIPAGVSCFHPKRSKHTRKYTNYHQRHRHRHRHRVQIVAEPLDVRSMSFVGTHEYLAPEMVSGEGHGNAVDWWTLGIFMFELFYGTTPFRGVGHELTLTSIVARALEFPKDPTVPELAKDLIKQLLVKDPIRRMGSTMGATAIKHHPFFHGVNWALLRCRTPPHIPPELNSWNIQAAPDSTDISVEYYSLRKYLTDAGPLLTEIKKPSSVTVRGSVCLPVSRFCRAPRQLRIYFGTGDN